MLPKDITQELRKRLRNIAGQINGIAGMVEEGKKADQVLIQFKAAKSGLEKAQAIYLDEVLRKGLAIKIVETVDSCPGNCGNEEKIEAIRQQFPEAKIGRDHR